MNTVMTDREVIAYQHNQITSLRSKLRRSQNDKRRLRNIISSLLRDINKVTGQSTKAYRDSIGIR